MGAEQFEVTYRAVSANQAFLKARKDAQYDYGHSGYTGTIAEKDSFMEFEVPRGHTVSDVLEAIQDSFTGPSEALVEMYGEYEAEKLFSVYDDKWGPAVALTNGDASWTFCGWASS